MQLLFLIWRANSQLFKRWSCQSEWASVQSCWKMAGNCWCLLPMTSGVMMFFLFNFCDAQTYDILRSGDALDKRLTFTFPTGSHVDGVVVCFLRKFFSWCSEFPSSVKTNVSNFQFGQDRTPLKSSYGWRDFSVNKVIYLLDVSSVHFQFLSSARSFGQRYLIIWLANWKKAFGNGHASCSLKRFILVTVTCCKR